MSQVSVLLRPIVIAAVISGFFATLPASAEGCPDGKVGKNPLDIAPQSSKGIKINILGDLDLSEEAPKLDGRHLRIRTITFEPNGYVPVHSHDQRPALAMVTQGELYEYTSDCKVPILRKTGDIIVEKKGVTHWVINKGKTPAVLTVSDIVDERTGGARGTDDSQFR